MQLIGEKRSVNHFTKFHQMFKVFLDVSHDPVPPIELEVVGKKLNRRVSYGLETPVKYRFYSHKKIVQ